MPRNTLEHSTIKTSTSNKWKARLLPIRFYSSKSINQKSDTWDTITDTWINFK